MRPSTCWGAEVRVLALLALPLISGCLTGTYTSARTHQPTEDHFGLEPGESDLRSCLDLLGAPLFVREHGAGAMLAWGWSRDSRWGLTLSVPVDARRMSLTYQRANDGLEGLVLLFDEAWTLTSIREGRLADVLPPSQRRVQVVE